MQVFNSYLFVIIQINSLLRLCSTAVMILISFVIIFVSLVRTFNSQSPVISVNGDFFCLAAVR